MKELEDLGSVIDYPGFNFQNALVKGLDEFYPNLKMVSTSYMSSYPSIKKWNFKQIKYSHKNSLECSDLYVGCLNLPIIKNISKFLRIRKALKRELQCSTVNNNIVILYELHSPFLLAVASLRKYYSKACIIVPDLPEFMTECKNPIYLVLKAIDRMIIHRALGVFTHFIIFSKHMKERLPIRNSPVSVLEGIYQAIDLDSVEKENNKTILYTGNLSVRSGTLDLLQAFRLIKDPRYRLWIRGNGSNDIMKAVQDAVRYDSRINFFEPMSTKRLRELQKKATVLINPSKKSDIYTRYFFPSKTMEYLASGTPTLMYKLDCLPEEYYDYLYLINEETPESIANKIIEVCSLPQKDLLDFGKKAEKFILEHKNPVCQAKIVADILNR